MHDHPINMLCLAEPDELVDDQGEVNRLLKKTMDEISVENRKKGAIGENSVDAMLKELGVQLPEGKTCQLQDFFFINICFISKYRHYSEHGMTVK